MLPWFLLHDAALGSLSSKNKIAETAWLNGTGLTPHRGCEKYKETLPLKAKVFSALLPWNKDILVHTGLMLCCGVDSRFRNALLYRLSP